MCFMTTLNIAWQYEPTEDMYYILDLRNDEWITLRDSAADLWKMLVDFDTVDLMIEKMMKEYSISRETAKKDIEDFILDMMSRGYIEKN